VFLYLPIVALVVGSFDASPLAPTWGGATLRWYVDLAADRELLTALGRSLELAFHTANASVLLGTLAAVALVRHGRFRGRTLFSSLVSAPLVMPEVIVGLSLLLLLVSMQRWLGLPERGLGTIWLGHVVLGLAYATVVVQARLQGMDPALEEAAADLGARPLQVFFLVTLPLMAQALASAWLLSFTLSLDDVVVSAFLSGPGSTTLPLVIFSRARLGMRPDINAAATVIVVAVSVVVVGASVLMTRAERRRTASGSRSGMASRS
jgi:putrescine transport system permease protein